MYPCYFKGNAKRRKGKNRVVREKKVKVVFVIYQSNGNIYTHVHRHYNIILKLKHAGASTHEIFYSVLQYRN